MVRMTSRPGALSRSTDPQGRGGTASRRLSRRLVQLYAGLVLYGVSMGLLVRAQLGVIPWDVLHQGLSRQLGVSMGTVVVALSLLLLLLWIPLRERPGLGTISNALVVGVVLDATLAVLPPVEAMPLRVLLVVTGVLLNAVATAGYIGVHLGPGPRDGLMTGLVRRTGGSVRVVRTSIEATVVLVGWLLGGSVGLGTVLYALAIGPLVQVLLPRLSVRLHA
ncbi:YitT family protein [Kocuria sp. M1R5S2]|uniref:membrane protein YczE n=1 Tax=Kocuria rhizosphaerae TaxID=3376285 RepID=UPI0037B27965